MPFRNIETYFSQAPQAKIKRSSFKYNMPVKFTMNAGDLVPFLCEEVLPGDTFDLKLSKVVRLSTSIHPTMDNLYMDTYFFFIPKRFLWDHWVNFNGENDKAWAQQVNYIPPQLLIGGTFGTEAGSYRFGAIHPQSPLQYLICPSITDGSVKKLNVLADPLNAYIKVWNDWFRSENLADECPMYTGDGVIPQAYIDGYYLFCQNTFGVGAGITDSLGCLKVAKFADYFSRSVPQPQKGSDVLIPADGDVLLDPNWSTNGAQPFFINSNGSTSIDPISSANDGTNPYIKVGSSSYANAYDPDGSLKLNGLEITVNNLRLAVQTQKLLEKDSIGGSRYIEMIKSHFGVISPDLRLQRSEYLGGKRTLINMSEVIQTSESTSTSPLGNLGGRSITTGIEDSFIKSFTEHGILLGVCCVRPDRTYSQGIEKKWFRFERLDYYYPVLANLGYMPIKEKEIFLPLNSDSVAPDDIFGYQEAWAEYRTQRGRNTGYMQPGITGSLASWTYADDYVNSPYLSSEWLYQGYAEVDRTLAIASNVAPQFICDFLVYGKAVRPLPVHSIPGLMDHF